MADMKAARLVERGRMECERTAIAPLAEGQVLVRTQLAAICGSDLHHVFTWWGMPPQPFSPGWPGHEGIGEVVESRSPLFKPGARVLTCPEGLDSRCFAEFQTIAADKCVPLPAYAGPLEHLLMAQQMGTTIFALRKHPLDVVGKTVMVMGQGSAGNFFAYNLKRAGAAKVIVSDLSEARLAASKYMGADVAVKADPATVLDTVREHTEGQGVDFLVEAVGSKESLLQSVDLVRLGGSMLCFGLPDTDQPVPIQFNNFFRKKLTMYSHYGTQHEPGRVSFRLALDLIARGQIDVSHMVSHRLTIEEINRAMRLAHDRSENALKITLSF